MSEMTGGELLLKCLGAEGVSVIFGLLDGSHNAFLARLEKYNMRFVSARHEAAAAHMAEAWARIRGEPGVVIGGIGPGAANMISGVATAFAEGSPLIAISGQRRRTIIEPDRGGAFQVLDLVELYRPVTKFAACLHDWRRLPELLRKAYRIATSGRPGPVYIAIPEDLMRGVGDEDDAPVYAPGSVRHGPLGPGDPARLAAAAGALLAAKRPLLHAGSGVTWANAAGAFVALGEHLGAVMTTTLAARGVTPEDHPQYIHILNQDALALARREADVVLVVGARLGELDAWGKPPLWEQREGTTLIQIDADPAAIGLNRPVDIGIVGDAQAALTALLAQVTAQTERRPLHDGFARLHGITAGLRAQLDRARQAGRHGVNSGQLVKTVRDFFPRDSIMVQDGGNTSLWCASYHPIYGPRSYLYTAKFGHLGTGLPYAIGAKLAAPGRPVYLISGDGAIGFNIQELETARRHGAAIIVIVAVDRGWGMERSSQLMAQIPTFVETDLYADARYDQIAAAFGCHSEMVTSPEQLPAALARAQEAGRPALIQVMVDPEVNMAPPGLLEFGSLVYRATD